MQDTTRAIFAPPAQAGDGPLYRQLKRRLEDAIASGVLGPGDALPSERDIAALSGLSRVTIRRAFSELLADGALVRRQGSGTYIAEPAPRVEQSLATLSSFTEDMTRRGMVMDSRWLDRGLYDPSPDEMVVLGLATWEKVARLARVRIADGRPLAIERASLSAAILPDPGVVGTSLYAALDRLGNRPVRAVQRIGATNIALAEAELLGISEGTACLMIERVAYLATGRIAEFTRSIYRGDAYQFVAELRS